METASYVQADRPATEGQRYVLDPMCPLTRTQLDAMRHMVTSLNTNYRVKHEVEERDFNFVVQPYHIPIIQRLFGGWKWQNVIKGRQVYITTLATLMMMDLCTRRPYFTCMVRNMTAPDTVQTIAEKFDYVIEHSKWLKKQVKGHKALKEIVKFRNGANIAVGQTGRSATKNFTLITEAAISAEKDPRGYNESYVGTTNGAQNYIIIQETSPYGYNNQFIQQVRKSRELERTGKLTKKEFRNYFAPWWVKFNNRIWDEEALDKLYPLPPEDVEYFAEVESVEPVRFDRFQKAFYVVTMRSKCDGNPMVMRQEHPSTLEEALQTFSSAYILRESLDVAQSSGRIGNFHVSSTAPCAVFWDFGSSRAHTAFSIMQLDHFHYPNHYKWVHSFSESGGTPLPVWFSRVNSMKLNIAHHFLPHDAGYENLVARKLTGADAVTIYDAFLKAGIRNVSILPKIKTKRAGFESANRFVYKSIFDNMSAGKFVEALFGATRKWDEKNNTPLDELDPANPHSHLYDTFELAGQAYDGHYLGMLDFNRDDSKFTRPTGEVFDGSYV